MLKTTCSVCGATLEYESQAAMGYQQVADEQDALTKWLAAHAVCRAKAYEGKAGK